MHSKNCVDALAGLTLKEDVMKDLIESVYIKLVSAMPTESKWTDSKYERIKLMPTTAKGNFGENFTTKLLNNIGINAKRVNGGIGDFDILLSDYGIKLEHKLATEDTSNSFQFNALDKNKNYDYVFCLGISPNELLFDIIEKSYVLSLTTRMTKADGGYKMTIRNDALFSLTVSNLKRKLKGIIKNV
jgi:hypothetical protein